MTGRLSNAIRNGSRDRVQEAKCGNGTRSCVEAERPLWSVDLDGERGKIRRGGLVASRLHIRLSVVT